MPSQLHIAQALAETVAETPGGVPSGVAYAALMGVCTLEQYQGIVATLIRAGVVTQDGAHILRPTQLLIDSAKRAKVTA